MGERPSSSNVPKRTALKLFRISIVVAVCSAALVCLAVVLWWPLAFDWEATDIPIRASIDFWIGIISAAVCVLATIVMIVSGYAALGTNTPLPKSTEPQNPPFER
jgi:hypothetical protein